MRGRDGNECEYADVPAGWECGQNQVLGLKYPVRDFVQTLQARRGWGDGRKEYQQQRSQNNFSSLRYAVCSVEKEGQLPSYDGNFHFVARIHPKICLRQVWASKNWLGHNLLLPFVSPLPPNNAQRNGEGKMSSLQEIEKQNSQCNNDSSRLLRACLSQVLCSIH